MSVPDIVIITGLSGSGMSSATNAFQDLGYFCVDNLPVTMLKTFGRLVSDDEEKGVSRAALVIDIREGEFLADFEKQLQALRALGLKVSVLFFEASDDVLKIGSAKRAARIRLKKARDCSPRSKTNARRCRRSDRTPIRSSILRTTRSIRCVASCSSGSVLTASARRCTSS